MLKEDQLLNIGFSDENVLGIYEPLDQFIEKAKNDDERYYILSMLSRPHLQYFLRYLEFTHFPPFSEIEGELQVMAILWQDLPWIIISIPRSKQHLLNDALEKSRLNIGQGLPFTFTAEGNVWFPIRPKHHGSIENQHPIEYNEETKLAELEKELVQPYLEKMGKK